MVLITEEYYDKQKDELQVLQSIFSDDIVSVKIQNCWKQPCPLELIVKLQPHSTGEKTFVSLRLKVVCTATYPDDVPQFRLHALEEISQKDADELLHLLVEKAKTLLGMEMIYDLCQLVQDFLTSRNKKPAISEHEKMLQKNAKLMIEQERIRAASESREIAEIAEENERRRMEKLNRRDEAGFERKLRLRQMNLDELGDCETVELLSPNFRSEANEHKRIYKLLNCKAKRPTVHHMAAEWMAQYENMRILVTEWSFEFTLGRKSNRKQTVDFDGFEKRLQSFVKMANQKLSALKISDQQFFSSYLFVNLKKISSSPTNFNCKIFVGQTAEEDDRCLADIDFLEFLRNKSNKYAPLLAAQLVCALKWLHDHGYVHRYMRPYAVWFTGKDMFRLSDLFLLPELFNLCTDFEKLTNASRSKTPSECEEVTVQENIGPQQRDLRDLGALLNVLLNEGDARRPIDSSAADFISLCQSAKVVEQLLDHNYLVKNFGQLPSDSSNFDSLMKNSANLINSRLVKEFQVIQWLGKGGFGDVFLARNKLDDNDYAVKRIFLNPKNDRLNIKIKREAKLFAKLNHEHVVRYYSAWIEAIPVKQNLSSTITDETSTRDLHESKESTSFNRVQLTTSTGNSSSSVSFYENNVEESNSSSGGDLPKGFGKLWQGANNHRDDNTKQKFQTLFSQRSTVKSQSVAAASDSEFNIVFEDDEDLEKDSVGKKEDNMADDGDASSINKNESNSGVSKNPLENQVLYIQMEYCSNSTLRGLIDSGKLYTDVSTIWRMFRELLSGLQYIHHQNMIHRDIKPMNIFIDGNWSIKIGDFGLATRDLFSQFEFDTLEESLTCKENRLHVGADLTKDIGTAMYIAPEIERKSSYFSKYYTSKIDVYSAGIVLFEMFYVPPRTATERIVILQNLRSRLEFPADFGDEITNQHRTSAKKLIVSMLELNPLTRPLVDTLLQSDMIPFIAECEEDDFYRTFSQTLRKKKSKMYKWMISAMFSQEVSPALNYCFDQQICLDYFHMMKREFVLTRIRQELERIFHLRAFIPLPMHLLLPYSNSNSTGAAVGTTSGSVNTIGMGRDDSAALHQRCMFLDHSGLQLVLPNNLRQTFVRYCTRNGISRLKRFAVGKAYVPSDTSGGAHPIERNECCVDNVGPSSMRGTIAAETIDTAVEIARRLKVLNGLRWTLLVGHVRLVRAICSHLGVGDVQTQYKIISLLHHISTLTKKPSNERKCELLVARCALTVPLASSLLKFFEATKSLDEFSERFRPLIRSKMSAVREFAKEALDDVSGTLTALRSISGLKADNLSLDASLCYRPQMFTNGLVFLIKVATNPSSSKFVTILAGGAYESSIEEERRPQDPSVPWPICAYGFDIALENLAHIHCVNHSDKSTEAASCIALVCTLSSEMKKAKYELARKLWDVGVSTDIFHENISDVFNVLEYCQKNVLRFLVIVTDVSEATVYTDESTASTTLLAINKRISFMGTRLVHAQVSFDDLLKVLGSYAAEKESYHMGSNGAIQIKSSTAGISGLFGSSGSGVPNAMISVTDGGAVGDSMTSAFSAPTTSNVNITFAMTEKPAHNFRKKIEMQVRNVLSSELLPKLNVKARVEVFVSDSPPDLLRQMVAQIDRHYEKAADCQQVFDTFLRVQKVTGRQQKSELQALFYAIQPFLVGGGNHSSGASTSQSAGGGAGNMPVTLHQPILIVWHKSTDSNFYKIIA